MLALALLVTLAGYLSAPYRAVRELQASVRERNQPAIAAALDLQSVSESLQDQVDELLTQAVAEAPRPGSAQAVFGRVGPTVARGLAGPLIQRVFSSAGMTEFLARNGAPARELVRIANGPPRGPAVNTRPRPPAVEDWLEPTESMRFHTPTRFAVQLSSGWVLLLRPYGLRWKVYDVRVPGDLFRS